MLKIYLNRLFQNKMALLGLAIIIVLALTALTAGIIAPGDPLEQDIVNRLKPPSHEHILGTDDLGRDVLSRVIYGTRVSLLVGVIAVSIMVVVGSILGLIAGYFGKWVDMLIMGIVDIMLCFPTFFLILIVLALLEPGIHKVMLVIGLTSWPSLTRLVRGDILSVRERDYIAAAKITGISNRRILFVHILPNVAAPIIVIATLGVGSAVLVESGLSFLGLGVQPPDPSWGNMLTSGKDYIHIAWWLTLYPGLAILITVLAFNLLGEGLRDVLDPRT